MTGYAVLTAWPPLLVSLDASATGLACLSGQCPVRALWQRWQPSAGCSLQRLRLLEERFLHSLHPDPLAGAVVAVVTEVHERGKDAVMVLPLLSFPTAGPARAWQCPFRFSL
jgi:hypothetical protein